MDREAGRCPAGVRPLCRGTGWNGFLNQSRPPLPALAVLVEPLFLDLHPWTDGFAWDRDFALTAGLWLGCLNIFDPDQPAGLTNQEMRSALRKMRDDA